MKKLFVTLCLLFATLLAPPALARDNKDRRIVVFNNGSEPIWRFYGSPSHHEEWEEDILHDNIIMDGSKMTFNLYNGTSTCYYDLKAVFKSGTTAVRRRVNICAIIGWNITDEDNTLIDP